MPTKRKIEQGKKGRKPIFRDGPTPIQHYAALLLGLGKKPYDVARLIKMSYESVRYWLTFKEFDTLVAKYREEFIEKIKSDGFDDLKFLTDTMVESLKSPAHRSDGLRARELLAKIRGEFSPEEMNLRIQKELEKVSDKELKKLAEEAIVLDANNTIKVNTRGSKTAGKPAGKVKV